LSYSSIRRQQTYNWFYLFEELTNTEALNRKKCTIFKTAKCETQIVLFLHSARNVDSLEDGDITQHFNSIQFNSIQTLTMIHTHPKMIIFLILK
jgi:hypothetical protein